MNVAYSEHKQYSSVDELEMAIKKAQKVLTLDLLQKLIGDMKSHVFDVNSERQW